MGKGQPARNPKVNEGSRTPSLWGVAVPDSSPSQGRVFTENDTRSS